MKLKLYLIFFLALCQQILAQSDYYWVGGAGSWSDLNHWRIGSSTGPQATIIPSKYDNVFFNNNSGFTASGVTLDVSPSATCKNFIVDDNFSSSIRFSPGSILNIYGNLKWRGNIAAYYNITFNLYSDSGNTLPNLIDIPGNLLDLSWISTTYLSSVNFLGNGSFKLINDFNSNGYFSFNVGESASLDSNNKNITVAREITYTSSAVSDFGTSQLKSLSYSTAVTSTFNANVNLTQASITAYSLSFPTTQNVKNISFTKKITVGTYLKTENITGLSDAALETSTGTGGYEIGTLNIPTTNSSWTYIGSSTPTNNIATLKVGTLTMGGDGNRYFYALRNDISNLTLGSGNSVFSTGKYNVDNLTLNGGNYFISSASGDEFKVNQNLIANASCAGTIPRFTGGNVIIPATANGGAVIDFPSYMFQNVKLTGGASVTAAIDNGGNTGNISFVGAASRTFYRIGGGGNWNDLAKWSFISGGTSANCLPTRFDDVIFDEKSGFTAGNNTLTGSSTSLEVRNMTWNNTPGNPIFNPGFSYVNIYGSLYLQKDMTAPTATFSFLKISPADPPIDRYMSFEGQKINTLYVSELANDNFHLQPASWAAPYDVEVVGGFSFNVMNNGILQPANLYANSTKINANSVYLGGKSVFIDHTLIRTPTLWMYTQQPVNAPASTLYIAKEYNGKKDTYTNANHFFGNLYMEGTATGTFSAVKSNLFQINSGIDISITDATTNILNVNAGNKISFTGTDFVKNFNVNTAVDLAINPLTNLTVTDTFVYNRLDCDIVKSFTGAGNSNLILGNTINGNGLVELNRLSVSYIRASYVTPVAGSNPINANNSIDNAANSGVNFTIPAPKNFYWKGGSGNWNDINHWSLDSTPARATSTCGIPTLYDNVFFDEYSGIATVVTTNVEIQNPVYVNNMTFSGLPATAIFNITSSNSYQTYINGDLTLYPGYGAVYNNNPGFTLINRNKPAGINKSVYPNGAGANLIFTDNANWKVYHGTEAEDMSSGSINQQYIGRLDLGGTVLKLNQLSTTGTEILLDGSDISASTINISPQTPVNSLNSILKGGSIKTNSLAHYFERIDIRGYYSNYTDQFLTTIDLPNTKVNLLNILTNRNSSTPITTTYATVRFASLKEVNQLNIEKSNIIELANNIKVNQSMLLQGGCTDADQLLIRGYNNALRQIIIPAYNTTDFIINRVRLNYISSSGGQSYTATESTNVGGNSGINFVAAPSRDLYWVGGQGNWNDGNHWSLTSGGTPVGSCGFPSAKDNVFFDANSGFTTTQKTVIVGGNQSSLANNVTFNSDPNSPLINGATYSIERNLLVYGNLVLQNNTTFGSFIYVTMPQSTTPGQTRYLDTKGVTEMRIGINASQDYFELQSPYKGSIYGTNVKGFKTNDYPMDINNYGLQFNYTQKINQVLDFGQSVITDASSGSGIVISSGNSYPVTINAANAKIATGNFVINVPNQNSFGDITINKNGIFNAGTTIHNFNKVTFLGILTPSATSTLASAGNYKTLYFSPGNYKIASGQNISENLFMTGTPCNRINISRTADFGQSLINLNMAASYTLFYASIQDMNFSRTVNAYGNSQDLGNTSNLTIVPTNVQAAGFGNKTLCASDFPKTYDGSALFGTDPNATYTWTKMGTPDVVISTQPIVTFTQPGSYKVNVTSSQDGCNITENFTVSSVALPVDNTTVSTASVSQLPMGNVPVIFKGSQTSQTYIFTYSINNGSDMEITSNTNGVATINHPRNVAGTFVYHLKGIRFANGMACPVVISNKDIVVQINPDCPTPGVVQMYGTELMGCTASKGAKRLAEASPISITIPSLDLNIARFIPETGIIVKEGTDIFLLRNINALPETLTGLPASKPHLVGAILYHNDHFYEGVENGKWIRIDND